MKDNLYIIGFAGALGLVCALLLTSVAVITAPYRENNARMEEVLNILLALNVPTESGDSSAQLLEKFERYVRQETRGDLDLYVYAAPEEPERPRALAVRFAGAGLWGPMRGFLAFEPDGTRIRALTFSHQEETPGLGGEIVAPWFRGQFAGREFSREGTPIRMRAPGTDLQPNEVHAITGATMTCDKLETILNGIIMKFIEETHE